jgi:hypothetical protein
MNAAASAVSVVPMVRTVIAPRVVRGAALRSIGVGDASKRNRAKKKRSQQYVRDQFLCLTH